MEPFLGSAYHLEEVFILLCFNEFRPTQTLTDPFLTVDRVGINRVIEFVFLLPSEAVNYGEELPYVVGSAFKHRALEQLGASIDEHSAIFHLAGIS